MHQAFFVINAHLPPYEKHFYWLNPLQVLSDNLPNKRNKLPLDLRRIYQGGLIVRCRLTLDKSSSKEEKSTFLKKKNPKPNKQKTQTKQTQTTPTPSHPPPRSTNTRQKAPNPTWLEVAQWSYSSRVLEGDMFWFMERYTLLWYWPNWSNKNFCFPKLLLSSTLFCTCSPENMYLQDLESLVVLLSLCHDLKGKDLSKTIWDSSTEKVRGNQYILNLSQPNSGNNFLSTITNGCFRNILSLIFFLSFF